MQFDSVWINFLGFILFDSILMQKYDEAFIFFCYLNIEYAKQVLGSFWGGLYAKVYTNISCLILFDYYILYCLYF